MCEGLSGWIRRDSMYFTITLSSTVLQVFVSQVINTMAISSTSIISTFSFFKTDKNLISFYFFRIGEKDVLFLCDLQFHPFYYIYQQCNFSAYLYYIGILHDIYTQNVNYYWFFGCVCISVGIITIHFWVPEFWNTFLIIIYPLPF